jgi:HEAT repeat protein
MDPIEALRVALAESSDEKAEAAVEHLGKLPAESFPDLIAALQDWLAAPDPEMRWWALRAAAAIPGEGSYRLLLSGLEDSQAAVRQCAAMGLHLHPEAQSVPALVQALQDEDALAARLAADALAAIGAAAVPALVDTLQRGQPAARRLAARALAMIGDPQAIPALFAALEDDSALIEYWANEGLERMGVGMSFFVPK